MKSINIISGKRIFFEIIVIPYLLAFILLFFSIGTIVNLIHYQKIIFSLIVVVLIVPYIIWLIKINQFIKLVQENYNEDKYYISIVYFCAYILLGPFFLQKYQGTELIKIMLIFHFLAMISSAYLIFYTSKRICTIENKRNLKIADYIETFILLSLYPIGVFYIQKRLNKIIVKK